MPLRKQGTLIKSALTITTAAAIIAAAPSGAAAAACVQAPTTKAFANFNDTADYSLAPGGNFETGTSGWSLTGSAAIVSGNEITGYYKGFSVAPGTKSLKLPVGATATSPEFCVDETNPHFRFMAKTDSMSGFAVLVLYRNAAGQLTSAQFTSSESVSWGDDNWAPSDPNPLATKIPLSGEGASATVQIKFISTGNPLASRWGGATLIDSVLVDPYRRG